MSWAQRQRSKFIYELLTRTGRINRSDLIAKFEISKRQASADLGRFQDDHPGAFRRYPVQFGYIESLTALDRNSPAETASRVVAMGIQALAEASRLVAEHKASRELMQTVDGLKMGRLVPGIRITLTNGTAILDVSVEVAERVLRERQAFIVKRLKQLGVDTRTIPS